MKRDDDFNKQFDLERTEWREKEGREPFWGFNAKHVMLMFIVGMVLTAILTRLVNGSWPYWLRPLLG